MTVSAWCRFLSQSRSASQTQHIQVNAKHKMSWTLLAQMFALDGTVSCICHSKLLPNESNGTSHPEFMYLIFSSVFCSPSHQRCLGTCVREKEPFLGPGRNKQVLTSDTVYLRRSSQCRMYEFLYLAGTFTRKCLESFLNIALHFIIQVFSLCYIFMFV